MRGSGMLLRLLSKPLIEDKSMFRLGTPPVVFTVCVTPLMVMLLLPPVTVLVAMTVPLPLVTVVVTV